MLTGCSRFRPLCIPGASLVHPFYTTGDSGDVPGVVADSAFGVAVAGAKLTSVSLRLCGSPNYGLGGTNQARNVARDDSVRP